MIKLTKITIFENVKKISRKVLTNRFFGAIIGDKFEYHNNDGDEEGRDVRFTESCRLVRDNG